MGLKWQIVALFESPVILLKSDQNGIEINCGTLIVTRQFKLKSDQNGIEIAPGAVQADSSEALKSDQNGIEIWFVRYS